MITIPSQNLLLTFLLATLLFEIEAQTISQGQFKIKYSYELAQAPEDSSYYIRINNSFQKYNQRPNEYMFIENRLVQLSQSSNKHKRIIFDDFKKEKVVFVDKYSTPDYKDDPSEDKLLNFVTKPYYYMDEPVIKYEKDTSSKIQLKITDKNVKVNGFNCQKIIGYYKKEAYLRFIAYVTNQVALPYFQYNMDIPCLQYTKDFFSKSTNILDSSFIVKLVEYVNLQDIYTSEVIGFEPNITNLALLEIDTFNYLTSKEEQKRRKDNKADAAKQGLFKRGPKEGVNGDIFLKLINNNLINPDLYFFYLNGKDYDYNTLLKYSFTNDENSYVNADQKLEIWQKTGLINQADKAYLQKASQIVEQHEFKNLVLIYYLNKLVNKPEYRKHFVDYIHKHHFTSRSDKVNATTAFQNGKINLTSYLQSYENITPLKVDFKIATKEELLPIIREFLAFSLPKQIQVDVNLKDDQFQLTTKDEVYDANFTDLTIFEDSEENPSEPQDSFVISSQFYSELIPIVRQIIIDNTHTKGDTITTHLEKKDYISHFEEGEIGPSDYQSIVSKLPELDFLKDQYYVVKMNAKTYFDYIEDIYNLEPFLDPENYSPQLKISKFIFRNEDAFYKYLSSNQKRKLIKLLKKHKDFFNMDDLQINELDSSIHNELTVNGISFLQRLNIQKVGQEKLGIYKLKYTKDSYYLDDDFVQEFNSIVEEYLLRK